MEEKRLSLTEFMERFGPALFAKAEGRFPARVKTPLYPKGGRAPLGAQALAIAGLVEALKEEKAAFLAGEMGTGKTYVAIRSLLEWKPKGRFLVLCPPHLTEKWVREVEMEGAKAKTLRKPKDLEGLGEGPFFLILSREKAKLGPGWCPAAAKRRVLRGGVATAIDVCPKCGREVNLPTTRRTKCSCGEPLWQEVPPRREALAHAIRRKLKRGFLDLLVLDEAHEYKGRDSAQGLVAASLSSFVGKTLLLTGTLFGGYASNLYHLFVRTLPEIRQAYPRESDFVAQYGVYERIYKEKEEGGYGYYTRRRETKTATRERPGLSPLLLTHLLPRSVFLRLPEVAQDLPPYGEKVELVGMDPEHKEAYGAFARDLERMVRTALAQGSKRLLGALVQAGLQVPDTTWQGERVVDELGEAHFHPLPKDYLHAKERRLISLVEEELQQGRRVLVYVQGTEKRDQLGRLGEVLKDFSPLILRADKVPPEEREAWIEKGLERGAKVLIAHPRTVQTGLDLIGFPTVVLYQPEYSVYVLRQAIRRSWRIGQREPVRVLFLAYKETLQTGALALIAKKARSSLAIEGELVEGGLTALAEEDPTLALAKALAGAISLEWKGGSLGLGEDLPLGPTIELPTLPEDRVVRTRWGKMRLKKGQPVLFAEVI